LGSLLQERETKQIMKQLIYIFLMMLVSTIWFAPAYAEKSVTNKISNQPRNEVNINGLKIAMLDLKRLYQPATSKRIKSQKAKRPPVYHYPENCMTWNKQMILNKSRFYDDTINHYARQHKVDGNLIRAVIAAESCFKPKAVSSAGARGLMQLIPDTATRFGVTNSFDHKQNIRGGTQYLKFLLDRFKGDLKKVIAAYNAGEGKVDQFKGIPPYKETQQYVKNVLKVYGILRPKSKAKHVRHVYQPPKLGAKPGRHGWQYNRRLAPQLYKK